MCNMASSTGFTDPFAEIARLTEKNKTKDATISEQHAKIRRLKTADRHMHKAYINLLGKYRNLAAEHKRLATRRDIFLAKVRGVTSRVTFQKDKELVKERCELRRDVKAFNKREYDFAEEAEHFAKQNDNHEADKFA
ncbi:hypothetical protein SLS60_010970 [Paraconiothyrium brasiliense]|uniref:Flagellar FliJ protein n=1 Tax=Paraconiothyrium brasiliense TaxID=300254 RepID=A0ABR3QMI8_9PLEO